MENELNNIIELEKTLEKAENKEKTRLLQRFFKTGKGEYGEGDVFLGISVPEQRKIARSCWERLNMSDLQAMLNSEIHEKRLIALLCLIEKYNSAGKRSDENDKEKIFDFYLKNVKANRINNWDLVDLSCHKILGDFLLNKDREILYELAQGGLWERRVAVISCFAFLRQNDFDDAINLSELLLGDRHDLIHKAVGWMLREIGKKDRKKLEEFLEKHYKVMPRTMLRYSIEKLSIEERKGWMRR